MILSLLFVLLTIYPGEDKDMWNLPEFNNDHGLVNLYSEVEKHQEKVFCHKFARKGKHTIQIICADGKAAIDALIID